jgi:four helix bundle protein
MEHTLSHETLDAYKLAVEVDRWFRRTRFPHGEAALKDQARRAADSVVLNLAEGAYRQGKERAKHYRIARGSAAEACTVLDLIDLEGAAERQQQLRRVVAMSCRLR